MSRRVAVVRSAAARVVWFCCAAVALLLAVAALLVGLRVDEQSRAGLPVRWAEFVDLPYVSRGAEVLGRVFDDPVQQTVGGWALAAMVWLCIGGAMVFLLRPRNG